MTLDTQRGDYRASVIAQDERRGSMTVTRHDTVTSAMQRVRAAQGLAVYESAWLQLPVRPHGMSRAEARRLMERL